MRNDEHNVASFVAAVSSGDRRALAQAITLTESSRADHRETATDLLRQLMPTPSTAMRVGVTGVPGVGKSTFIESIGLHAVGLGRRVAVLSIDPSSAASGGSILGDKTRMELLAQQQNAFIRPSPSGTVAGGVARRTREAIVLCESAGFDVVIVETIGVGQSETVVADMTDILLLLMLPNSGDELQGIKRGIMELADLVLVNKADGEWIDAAQQAVGHYRLALGLLHPRSRSWTPHVDLCSSKTGDGIPAAWDRSCDCQRALIESGELEPRRAAQAWTWMWNEADEILRRSLKDHPEVRARLPELEAAVMTGSMPPALAAQELLGLFRT
jgi:LAO/AO transport system kinase